MINYLNIPPEGINVLSLFDGMSCGQIALQVAGIKVNQYYASEIDKHAMKVTQTIFPNTIQLGDVTKVSANNLPVIHLVIGGSPCQGFSFAGKQLAFDDPRSFLFFEYVRIWKEVKHRNPNAFFLLENVKMKKEHEVVFSQYMGVNPIEINSALVSAQNRVRNYWTNIYNQPSGFFADMQCIIPQPKDKGILLRDILESNVAEKYYLSEKSINKINRYNNSESMLGNDNKAHCLHAGYNKIGRDASYVVAQRGRGEENTQQLEPRTDGKTNTITSVQKDNLVIQLNPSTESGGKQPYQQNRIYDVNGISPALCANKSDLLIKQNNYIVFNDGFEQDNRAYFENGKSGTLDIKPARQKVLLEKQNSIRRLTPRECGRLQTVPDPILEQMLSCGVSDTQLYRMFGNGWTIDVIAHLFSYLIKPQP